MAEQRDTFSEDIDSNILSPEYETNDDDLTAIPASSINTSLNELFMQRLENLELNAPDNLQLALLVYQEWIEALLHSTQTAIIYKEQIEEKILQKLKPFQYLITTNVGEVNAQCQRCRSDIEKVIQFIQRAFHNNDWNMAGLQLETMQKIRKN